MVLSHAGTDRLYFLLEIGRSHGTRPVAILTDTPTFSSGCTKLEITHRIVVVSS